jgi:hypothetical protein
VEVFEQNNDKESDRMLYIIQKEILLRHLIMLIGYLFLKYDM